MEQVVQGLPRTYIIKRSQHLGYGFMAGYESPTMVKVVEPNGPSFKRLQPGDVIMAVNGIDVENATREEIIRKIQLCGDQIEITVRQQTYEGMIRAKNLRDPKFYTLNKSGTNLSVNNFSQRQSSMLPSNLSPLNRLVTSISQQQPLTNSPLVSSPNSTQEFDESRSLQVKTSDNILKPKPNNGIDSDVGARLFGKNLVNYGRHSPLPQRCKSSMNSSQAGNTNKKSGDTDNDQPLLKRSNTMRPFKPPSNISKVMEIFEVVVKIFLEVGQTRVLNYNQDTTVGTILEMLNTRVIGSSPHSDQIKRYFGLVLKVGDSSEASPQEHQPKRKSHILNEDDSIMKIRQFAYACRLRILYRMVYPPSDVSTLYAQSKVAFEYLYQQSCNDLMKERFSPGLDHETALKLSALHLLEYVHSNHSKAHGNSRDPKVYIKLVKKTKGIEDFVPISMAKSTAGKKGRKKKLWAKLADHLKRNFEEFDFEPPKVKSTTNLNRYSSTSFHELSLPERQSSSSDYIKLIFLNYLSQLPCYAHSKLSLRASGSPAETISAGGDCSSSLESVPRTSDSAPLIKQERAQNAQSGNGKTESVSSNNMSRLAQMNSIRSLSSVQSSSAEQPADNPDMVQTPSIESISSIFFNTQSSPSPQPTAGPQVSYVSRQSDRYTTGTALTTEPSPKPRQQILACRTNDLNSIEKIYNQRYVVNEKPIEELLKKVILLPPPPLPASLLLDNTQDHFISKERKEFENKTCKYLTQVLSDHDIARLRVPPPPKVIDY